MKRLLLIALASVLAAPLSAQVYRAPGKIDVTPVPGGFAVEDGGGMGARGVWCAAADYAARELGVAGTTRLYVANDSAPRVRAPVVFTLDPGGMTTSRVFIVGGSIRRAGANLSVDHALSFCADFRLINR
ncbi:MAG: hypothetical protein P1U53_04525 [Sulfitobacter sp.]|nr:hypothetical protein [Sulfitobacter sp.]